MGSPGQRFPDAGIYRSFVRGGAVYWPRWGWVSRRGRGEEPKRNRFCVACRHMVFRGARGLVQLSGTGGVRQSREVRARVQAGRHPVASGRSRGRRNRRPLDDHHADGVERQTLQADTGASSRPKPSRQRPAANSSSGLDARAHTASRGLDSSKQAHG